MLITKTKAIAVCAAFGAITTLGFSGAKSASAAVPSTRLHQTLTAGIMDHHDWDRDHDRWDRDDRWQRERAERIRRDIEARRYRQRFYHHDNGNHFGWWNTHNNHRDWDRDRDRDRDRDWDRDRDRDRDRDWDHDRR